ncbi:MAG: hypothetical protein IJ713_07685 [Oscillibacter sp.]|nr:hypothetical protein [Oscillibacter sp.]
MEKSREPSDCKAQWAPRPLGGGSLTAGGAGMAGGTAALGGLLFAPMIMVGGIALNSKGKIT